MTKRTGTILVTNYVGELADFLHKAHTCENKESESITHFRGSSFGIDRGWDAKSDTPTHDVAITASIDPPPCAQWQELGKVIWVILSRASKW